MAYQAIYRKWRPLVFDDIIGQTHVTRTLRNQIESGRIAHAYLFCGTRGTGKTTAAKVFSRAVNCERPVNGSPCNECGTCRGILDGSILDVSEIDAASNNGVDNIREIREDVNYVATQSKYRVYIIDEVHMLSQGAFNALLKTLEEPPPHVIFILATTEAQRIPETILSRCQRFDFKRIRPADIIVRMKEIAMGDGLTISDDAYNRLARFADGSMRDGLSLLERCISECGTTLSGDDVMSVLGVSSSDTIFKITSAIAQKDTYTVLEQIDGMVSEGKDLNVFMDEFIKHFRDIIVCKVTKNPEELLDRSAEETVTLKSQADKIAFETASRAIEVLSKVKADAKWIKNPRIMYELALIRLTQPELDTSPEALTERIARLEEQVKNGVVTTVAEEKKEPEEVKEEKPKKKVSARLYTPLDVNSLKADSPIVLAARKWDKAAQSIASKMQYVSGAVVNRRITIDGEGIILIFDKSEIMMKKIASTYIKQIQAEFRKIAGGNFVFKTAFYEDVEDNIVDFWKISGTSPHEEESGAPEESGFNQPVRESPVSRKDPLDTLSEKFPEIIEFTDESEFVNYKPEAYQQVTLDDEQDEKEEFLESNEQETDE